MTLLILFAGAGTQVAVTTSVDTWTLHSRDLAWTLDDERDQDWTLDGDRDLTWTVIDKPR